MHPVKRELLRLLAGIALCAVAVLAAYLMMDGQLDRMRQKQARFHVPALSMCAELSNALASMKSPPGVSASSVQHLDDEVAFVSSVTRDFGRAQSLLSSLITLHQKEAEPEFARTLSRLARARDELMTIYRSYRDEPLALARLMSLKPVYASVVAQQTQRLHEQASQRLQAQQARAQKVFVSLFTIVCIGLGFGLALQLRRSLRGIDGILARERSAHERVAAVLAAVPDLWFVLDARGCFTEVCAPDHPDLDTAWDELKDHPFQLVPAPCAPIRLPQTLSGVLRRTQMLEYEVAVDTKGPRTFEARLVPTANDHWLYLSRDISERKRTELALARSNEELEHQVTVRTQQLTIARDVAEKANRAKSEFLSRMSHELRTPMNAVLGFAQLLGLDPTVSQQHRQSLDHILRAGKHLLHLINDVLDLAHVESGRMTLSPEPLGVEDIVTEVVALMKPQAQRNRIRIEVAPVSGSVVRGDRLRVKQVLLNLTSNAVKYNRPDGWVRLYTEVSEHGRIRIVVEDSGQGLPDEDLSRLFEPFSRFGSQQSAIEGTGIGLSISKRLMELMQGQIGATSTAGVGSKFWIELPSDRLVPAPADITPEEKPSAPDALLHHACVLYVEDNPDNLALVSHIVARHANVRLICAPSAALGFDLAFSHRPDLILLDLHLPDASGYVLLDRLRANEETGAIPVVAVTANAMPEDQIRAREAGFTAYLTKPLDVGKFDSMLREIL
jgi:signal transduction histidine kinase